MPSTTASHERPREEWIEIPVPALVPEESFARAQELLHENKIRSRRRTIAPSVVQGLVSCQKCGYAFSRTSTQTSARKIHYYKCIGSDSWRKLGGPVCDNRRCVRQELLDQIVWAEVIRLLEEPTLIQQELDRRLAAARSSDPTKKREQSLQRELTHVGKGMERLLNAYQEELLSIEQLRERMPVLRQRQQTLRAELQAIADQTNDRAAFLRLAETLTAFLARLRSAAETLSVMERQRIVRLLVKDVLVGEDTITIRHSIPIPSGTPQNGGSESADGQNYLLCKGRDRGSLRNSHHRRLHLPLVGDLHGQAVLDQPQHASVHHALFDQNHQLVVRNGRKVAAEINLHHAPRSSIQIVANRLAGHLRIAPWSITVRAVVKIGFKDWLQHQLHRSLHHAILDGGDPQWASASLGFWDVHSPHRLKAVGLGPQLILQSAGISPSSPRDTMPSMVSPSTPGAPRFSFTRFQASPSTSLRHTLSYRL
jgi:site-specific DNA recombinase